MFSKTTTYTKLLKSTDGKSQLTLRQEQASQEIMSTGNTYIVLGEQLLSEVDDLGLQRLLCRLEPKSETQHGRSATEAA